MRNRLIGSAWTLLCVLALAFSWVVLDRTTTANGAATPQIVIQPVTPTPAGQGGGGGGRAARNVPPAPPHDPHDLNGVWLGGGGGGGGQAADLAPAAVRTEWMKAPLPLTAAGVAAINNHKGGKGPRGVAPSKANDPIGDANPPGLVRTLVYGRPIQFITLPDMMVNLFEWYHMWRQIHMDGRKLPEDPDTLWYGSSIGHWDGDTFVVNTIGMDTRSWLDEWGAPFSDVAKATERWHRLDRDNMALTVTIDDPKFYTKSWTSDVRNFKLPPKGDLDSELEEVIFAPWDEQNFNKRIRDPNPIVTTGYQGNPTQR